MDLRRNKPMVDFIFAGFNLVAATVWLGRSGNSAFGPWVATVHLLLAFTLMAVPGYGLRPRRWILALRSAYPWLLWVIFWSEIGWLFELVGPAVNDPAVMAFDRALFGFHWNEVLSSALPWLRNFMGLSYLSYYLLILVPPLILIRTGRHGDFQKYLSGLMATYLTCFAIYMIYPVAGPRDLGLSPDLTPAQLGGVFGPIMEAFFEAGDSGGTAFPSSHCAGSVASALLIAVFFGRRAARLAGIWAACIVLSTVYTNNHYVTDATFGTALAFVMVGVVLRPEIPGGSERRLS